MGSQETNDSRKKDKRKLSNKKKVTISIFSVLLALVLLIALGYFYVRSKIYRVANSGISSSEIQKDISGEKEETVEETTDEEETVEAIDEVSDDDSEDSFDNSEEAVEEEKDTNSDVLDEIMARLDAVTDGVSELMRAISAIALSGGGNMATDSNVDDALGEDDGDERALDDEELIEMFAKVSGE